MSTTQRVVRAREGINVFTKKDRWFLTLACGHKKQTGRRGTNPPRRVPCPVCDAFKIGGRRAQDV